MYAKPEHTQEFHHITPTHTVYTKPDLPLTGTHTTLSINRRQHERRNSPSDQCPLNVPDRRTGTSKGRLLNNYQRLTDNCTKYYGGPGLSEEGDALASRVWWDIAKTMYSRQRSGDGAVSPCFARRSPLAGAGRVGLACPAIIPEGLRAALFRCMSIEVHYLPIDTTSQLSWVSSVFI